jgi:type I site-specific restriction-modification system R (restriction) subunit
MLEQQIENDLITKLTDLKYTYRPDIRDRAALERNFREKFEALNKVRLTEDEFSRLLEQIITAKKKNAIPGGCRWLRLRRTTTISTSPATSAPPSPSR